MMMDSGQIAMVELCSVVEGINNLKKSRSMLVVTFRVVKVFLSSVCDYFCTLLFPRYSIYSKAEAKVVVKQR
jgi:hypothetical protein